MTFDVLTVTRGRDTEVTTVGDEIADIIEARDEAIDMVLDAAANAAISAGGLFLGTRAEAAEADVPDAAEIVSVIHPPYPATFAMVHTYTKSTDCTALVTGDGKKWRPMRVDDVRAWGGAQGYLSGNENVAAANAALAYCGCAYFAAGGVWYLNGPLLARDWLSGTQFQPIHIYGDGPHVTSLRQLDLTADTIFVKHRNLTWEGSDDPDDYLRVRMKPIIHDMTINYQTNATTGAGGRAVYLHEAKDGLVYNLLIDGPDYYIYSERAVQMTYSAITGQVTKRNDDNPAEAFFVMDDNRDLAALPKPRALDPGKSFGCHIYGCEFQGAAGVEAMFDLRSCDGLDIIGGHFNGHKTLFDLRGCDGTGGRTTIRQLALSGFYADGDGDTRWIFRAGPWPTPDDWEEGDEPVIIDGIKMDATVMLRGRAGRQRPTGIFKITAAEEGDLDNLETVSNLKFYGCQWKAMNGVLFSTPAHASYSAAVVADKYTRWNIEHIELTESFYGGAVKASGTLTFTGAGTNGNTVTIGSRTYTLVSTLTGANEVLIGGSAAATGANLVSAINATSGAGTTYGSGTVIHADVSASGTDVITLTAKVAGDAGNDIVTTEVSTAMVFDAATLTGGYDAADDDDDPEKPAFVLNGSGHEIESNSFYGYRDESDKFFILMGSRASNCVVENNKYALGTTKFLSVAAGAEGIIAPRNYDLDAIAGITPNPYEDLEQRLMAGEIRFEAAVATGAPVSDPYHMVGIATEYVEDYGQSLLCWTTPETGEFARAWVGTRTGETGAFEWAEIPLEADGAVSFGSGQSPVDVKVNGANWHCQQIPAADDAVATVTPARNGGFFSVTCAGSSTSASPAPEFSARGWFDIGTTLNIIKDGGITGVGTDVDVVTTDVTGTTGTDGKVTISVQSGVIKIENRSGAHRNFQVVLS